jgi:DNA repair photolyase
MGVAALERMFDTGFHVARLPTVKIMMRTFADVARPGRDRARGQLPLALQTARKVTTPEFAGMTFLEVETKSALNKVSGMPFGWSINPYRGCSHACSYCVAGDTPVLMADGRTRPMALVRTGDAIYGTRRRGWRRWLVRTRVLDHWAVTKPAYRIRLAGGTDLVTSGDHRFLTDRGWTYVAGAEHGDAPRPQLTDSHRLVGLEGPDGLAARKGSIRGVAVEPTARTRVEDVAPLGLDLRLYDITTGTGDYIANGVVSHNCFARPTHRYLELSPAEDFERMIVVKTNVVDVLRAELARPGWRGEKVALGTNTDPYQRCEGRYRLLPGIIRALADGRTPLSILTKGTLIMRDRSLLAEAATQVDVTAALTVGMLDEECWRASEPGTPHPRARLDAVRSLNDAGVPTGVMLAPIMPGINDDREQLAAVIDAAAAAGATHITPIILHLRPGVREVFWPWLERMYPQLVGRYRTLYRGSQASKDYRDGVQRFVEEQRRQARRRYGRPEQVERSRHVDPSRPSAETVSRAHAAEQLRLI